MEVKAIASVKNRLLVLTTQGTQEYITFCNLVTLLDWTGLCSEFLTCWQAAGGTT